MIKVIQEMNNFPFISIYVSGVFQARQGNEDLIFPSRISGDLGKVVATVPFGDDVPSTWPTQKWVNIFFLADIGDF